MKTIYVVKEKSESAGHTRLLAAFELHKDAAEYRDKTRREVNEAAKKYLPDVSFTVEPIRLFEKGDQYVVQPDSN